MATRYRLTVAHNGDRELVPQLARFGCVESVFGKMPNDLVGGGRSSFLLADMDFEALRGLIGQAHAHDMQFIYLLNSPCLSNLEITRDFNNRLFAFIGSLVEAGVDAFVVAMPYMLEMIKRHFPQIKVSISTFALIDSVRKARYWEGLGADRLILQQDLNRNFILLRKIRTAVSCELELFANNMCLFQCPIPQFHAAYKAHSSSSKDLTGGFCLDYCAFNCALRRLEDPAAFIRGRFIRPEDVHLYENLGIDVFKLADRVKDTAWLVNTVAAYAARRYDGNLTDLIPYPYLQGDRDVILSRPEEWLLRPDHVNLEVLTELRNIGASQTMVTIDNRRLDGFCEHFQQQDCLDKVCGQDCGYCAAIAEQAVAFDQEKTAARMTRHRYLLEMLISREAFAAEALWKRAAIRAVRGATSVLRFGRRQLRRIRGAGAMPQE